MPCFDDDFNLSLKRLSGVEIPSEFLPEPETYFEFSNLKIQEYINELSDNYIPALAIYKTKNAGKAIERSLYEFYQPVRNELRVGQRRMLCLLTCL